MTEEEKRRRLQAYALQNFTGQLKVQDTPQAPKVTVAAPQPQQQIRQAQPTQFRAEVTTPYRKENFVANQPQPQTGAMAFLGRNVQPAVKSFLGSNQQGDNRNLLSKAWDQVNQMDSGRSFRQNTPTTKDSGLTQYGKAVMGPLAGVQLRGFRTVGGAAEGASGLVDWVTPGTGTSRVTQGLSKFNANLDKTAKDVGGNGAYNITAVPSEVASFFVPSKAIATGASYIPKATKLISTVDKGLNKFGSKFGKVGKAITGTFRPTEIGTEAAITGKYIGEDVSKGKEITPQRVLTDITTGAGGDSIVRVINSLRRLKIKNVDDLAIEKDAGKIEEAIIRDAPEIPADKAKDISIKLAEADTPEKVTGVLAAAKTDLATPTTPDLPPTQAIQPEVIKNLTVNKTPEQVKVAVKALYPKLDDVSLEAVSQRIAKSTNDKEVEQTLLEASRRSENVTTAVDNAVAPKVPEQTLEQAVEPQTAPQTIQTPEAPITQTTQPNIPGATTVDNVPNAAPIEKTPTVKPATPENVYGVNALEKAGKKLGLNQGGGIPNPAYDPLDALKAEARKYKSAEEFVNSKVNMYHGTPYEFDKFDSSKILTGEAENAMGRGLYMTDSPDVADYYKRTVTKKPSVSLKNIDGTDVDARTRGQITFLKENKLAELPKDQQTTLIKQQINAMESLVRQRNASPDSEIGKLLASYKKIDPESISVSKFNNRVVKAYGDNRSFIDYKSPLSTEQVTKLKKTLGDNYLDWDNIKNGEDLYFKLARKRTNPEKILSDAGIKGIKYPVGELSAKQYGGSNYVFFDDKNLLTEKQLTDLYNQATKPKPNIINRALGLKDSSQGGFAKLPGKGAPIEKTPVEQTNAVVPYTEKPVYTDRPVNASQQELPPASPNGALPSGTPPPTPPNGPLEPPSGDIPPTPDINTPTPQSFLDSFGENAGKLWQRVKEQLYDPQAPWQKAEDSRNKAMGIKLKDSDASRSLTYHLNRIITHDIDANRALTTPTVTGESVADVFNRYPDIKVRKGVKENGFVQYLQFRFFNEIYDKSGGKVWKSQQFTPEQTQRYIAQFEANNPTALNDAATMKAWADGEVDKKIASREITPEHGENIKNAYTVFTPLDTAIDPDLVGATISGGRGGVGTEKIAQNITDAAGNYDTSWDSVFNRNRRYASETAENNLSLELDRSVRDGHLTKEKDDVYIVIDPDKQAQRAAIIQNMNELRPRVEALQKGKGKLALGKKMSKKEIDRAWVEASESARQYLLVNAQDEAAVSIAKRMGRDKLFEVFRALVAGDEIKAARIIKKLGKNSAEYTKFADELAATQDSINMLKAELSGDWKKAAELNQQKPKNENLVPYYKNGQKGYIHISNDMARVRNEMKSMADRSKLSRAWQAAANAQKWAFTGGGAPLFKMVTNPIRSQLQAFTLAPGLSPFGAKPIGQGIKSVFTNKNADQYVQKAIGYGFRPEVATKTSFQQGRGVEQIASMSGKGPRAKYLSKHWGELFNVLNSGMAKLDNAARVQVMKGVELRTRRLHPEWSEEQVMTAAARAGNEVLGNFNRVSKLAREVEPLILYSGATQSGFRQLMRTFRERPIETGAKVLSLVAAVASTTYFMLGGDEDYNEQMQEYYRQKIASGNTNELDSNLIFGIPGKVKYDENTNTWSGIVKVPIPPDYKPLVRASWKTAYGKATDGKIDPALIGRELANFGTADQSSNIRNPKTGMLFPSSPILTGARIAMGQNPKTGKQLDSEQEKYLPAEERYDKYTSGFGKFVSKSLNGLGLDATPRQIDAILSQSGYFGSKIKSAEDGDETMGTLKSIAEDFTSKVYGSRGFGEKQQGGKTYSEGMDALYKKYKLDKNQYDIVQTMYPVKKDKDGKDIKPEGYYVSSIKAQQLANSLMSGDGKVWEFAKEASKLSKKDGELSDPLFELDKDKAQIVLALMSDAKPQSLDKKKIMKDNPWIKDFYNKRGEFWDQIMAKKETNYERDVNAGLMTEDELDEIKSNVGKDFKDVVVPRMTPELKAKKAELDKLNKPEDAINRYEFMKANPDLQEYFDDNNAYSRFKRTVMRLPLFDEYPKASPKVEAIMNEYNALPKGDGPVSKYTGKATSPSRNAWYKNNPEKAALMSEQYYKQNLFDLQGAAALAQYEGESLDESAFDDIKSIADYRDKLEGGTGSSGYSGYSKFGYSKSSKKGSKSGSSGSDTTEKPAKTYAAQLLSGLPTDFAKTPNIDTTPKKAKFKVKTPSGKGRSYKRIRLQ